MITCTQPPGQHNALKEQNKVLVHRLCNTQNKYFMFKPHDRHPKDFKYVNPGNKPKYD